MIAAFLRSAARFVSRGGSGYLIESTQSSTSGGSYSNPMEGGITPSVMTSNEIVNATILPPHTGIG